MRFENLEGKKFNYLTVIERVKKENSKQTYWKCKCECGNITITTSPHLKDGHTRSCGCLQKQKMKEIMTTHNLSNTRIFKIWCGIKDRTMRTTHKSHKNYGAKGIKMCDEWMNSFEAFYNWAINNGYQEYLTIDRINNNDDYKPNNCRWITMKAQQNNRTNNHNITYKGITHTMKEWSEILGINYTTLSMRLNKYNWSVERSFNYGKF